MLAVVMLITLIVMLIRIKGHLHFLCQQRKKSLIMLPWFTFPKPDMKESSNPIDDVTKWNMDGHSTSSESEDELFELAFVKDSITQKNKDDNPFPQKEWMSSESEGDLFEISHGKSNIPKNLKEQSITVFERGSTSKDLPNKEIEEEKVHTKEGAPITKQNQGEEQVASSSHISGKDIPHHPVQARAQPDIVGGKDWSCKPKTVKSKKKNKSTKQKTEGTMQRSNRSG
uniref:Candidate secreted effector n=1 Tax=Meloidogyne incognita TaxID=6306 RepID=A0A914LEZ8_MELIC